MIEVMFKTNGVRTSLHNSNNFTVLTEEENVASKLECKVYADDESFGNIFPGLTDVIAYDTALNEVVFEGTVYSSKPTADQTGAPYNNIICNHLLSRLGTANVVGFEDASGNLKTMVGRILDIYNSTALDQYKIYLGTGPSTGGHPEVVHIFSANCFDAITQLVVEDAGWEFRARYDSGKWYLDIANDFGEFDGTTELISGVNMLNISKTVDASELYTRIIPIGGASYIPSDHINPVMSTLTSSEGMPLTLYKYSLVNPDKIFVENASLETKYPILAKVVQYDDITATDDTDFATAQAALYNRAVADAARLTDIVEAYETTAIDLARAGYNYDFIRVGTMYHIVNNKLDIDTYLKVSSKKTDYSNPAKCDLTFGHIGRTASRYLARKGKTTDQKLNGVGSTSYKTTDTRMGGLSMRNVSKSDYDTSDHDDNTLYTVSDAGTGKVELYKGDTKISGAGGWVVDTAAVFDANNLHQWVADEELMADINAQTKLYYGGAGRIIPIQGYACRFGNSVTLTSEDRTYFGTEIHMDLKWRVSSGGNVITTGGDVVLSVNSITALSSGGYQFVFGVVVGGLDWEEAYTTTRVTITDPQLWSAFLVPTVTSISGESTYISNWGTKETIETPYGYAQCRNITLQVGVIANVLEDSTVTLYPLRTSGGQTTVWISGRKTNGSYSCVPLENLAEKYYDMGVTKRTEPRNEGGSNG